MTDEQYNKATELIEKREEWFQEFNHVSKLIKEFGNLDAVSMTVEHPSTILHTEPFLIKGEFVKDCLQKHMAFCKDNIDSINEKIKSI
jgi:uncharacterized protein YjgD (DUF1641 family)